MKKRDTQDGGTDGASEVDRDGVDTNALMPPSNAFLDALERVLPDLPMLGALMVLFVVYLACTGAGLGASNEVLAAMQEADDAAAQAIGYVPF